MDGINFLSHRMIAVISMLCKIVKQLLVALLDLIIYNNNYAFMLS